MRTLPDTPSQIETVRQSLLVRRQGHAYFPRYVAPAELQRSLAAGKSRTGPTMWGEVDGMKLGRRFSLLARMWIPATLVVAALPCSGGAEIVARAALVVDAQDGRTLYAKNPDLRMYPASTTKVMTAILAIESGRLDEMVTIHRTDVRVEPSVIGLVPGERISLRDLVYGLMLRSGNDAARAIARHLGGSQELFAALMNGRAGELGCTATNFTNPHGLPHPRHYTTARDLGRIMRHAMHDPEFRRITGARSYRSRSSRTTRDFYNKNKLLRRYAGATGGKPGYTRAAQQTLVASAQRSGHELVVVCLASRGRALWSDASSLLDLGFRRVATSHAGGGVSSTAAVSSR